MIVNVESPCMQYGVIILELRVPRTVNRIYLERFYLFFVLFVPIRKNIPFLPDSRVTRTV